MVVMATVATENMQTENTQAENSQAERLQKILAMHNVASRRAAEQMIVDGRVCVNGRVAKLGDKADPAVDEITLDGKALGAKAGLRYLLLYKPAGFITSVTDPRGRRTVMDLVADKLPAGERIYPVGRLDYATGGLLLMTNDGELANGLLHPAGEINKTYECAVRGSVNAVKLRQLSEGVRLSDGMTAPAKARQIKRGRDTVIEITIHEGRNRQVRRMMQAVGLEVVWLKRVGFAGLDLQGLRPGESRSLTKAELSRLKRLIDGK